MIPDLSVILLAAGASTRMGVPKALLPWGERTVLEHILGTIREAGLTQVLVVTGAHHQELAERLPPGTASLVFNPDWNTGMGGSIRTGMGYLQQTWPQTRAVLILLADQPLIGPEYLKNMVAMYEDAGQKGLIASKHMDGLGVPALFSHTFFRALFELPEGQGAKQLIQQNKEHCLVADPGETIRDMDTPEAYRDLLRHAGHLNNNPS